jgi:hypothetical protein
LKIPIFAELVEQKIASGLDLPSSVFSTIEERKEQFTKTYIDAAKEITVVANELNKLGYTKTASALAKEADSIIKEALFGNFFRDRNDVYQVAMGSIEKKLTELSGNISQYAYALDTQVAQAQPDKQQAYIKNYVNRHGPKIVSKLNIVLKDISAISNSNYGFFGGKKATQTIKEIYNTLSSLIAPVLATLRSLQPENLQTHIAALAKLNDGIGGIISSNGDLNSLKTLQAPMNNQQGAPATPQNSQSQQVQDPTQPQTNMVTPVTQTETNTVTPATSNSTGVAYNPSENVSNTVLPGDNVSGSLWQDQQNSGVPKNTLADNIKNISDVKELSNLQKSIEQRIQELSKATAPATAKKPRRKNIVNDPAAKQTAAAQSYFSLIK